MILSTPIPKLIRISVILLLPLSHSFARTWTNKTGTKIEAEYVSSDEENVTIRKKGVARSFTIPLSSLSETDIDFVTELHERDAKGKAASGKPASGDGARFGELLKERWQRADHGNLPYQIFGPRQLEAGKKYTIVLFLHGAGERGTDGEKQIANGVETFADKRSFRKNPCLIVAPQCPPEKGWSGEVLDTVLDLIDQLIADLAVDEDRVYVTGLSMGGAGTWSALSARPEFFAAALPVCGGGNPGSAAGFHKVPIRVFHGDADTIVSVEKSRAMVKALRDAGGEPIYNELPGVGHNAWDTAYADDNVIEWLFEQKRKPVR